MTDATAQPGKLTDAAKDVSCQPETAATVTLREKSPSKSLHSPAASPRSSPAAQSRPGSASVLRSPVSWFNRTTSSSGSGNPKHSLLAMVPSQPLSRPTGSASPSPAGQLQPPSIPALEQLKQSEALSSIPELPASLAAAAEQPGAAAAEQPGAAPAPSSQSDASHLRPESGAATNDKGELHASQLSRAQKQAKRDKRLRKTEASMRWQLMRKLANISADVEMLNHEVQQLLDTPTFEYEC